MTHDVFVSHSSKDKLIADAVVAYLEKEGIRCWVAPRDIPPGANWPLSIMAGINQCRVMVVLFSEHANQSEHVCREIERAIHRSMPVIPMRIMKADPQGALEYLLSTSHWLDAFSPPLAAHMDSLAGILQTLLQQPVVVKLPKTPVPAPWWRRRQLLTASIAALLSVSSAAVVVVVSRPDQATLFQDANASLQQDFAEYERLALKGPTVEYFAKNGPLKFDEWLKQAKAGNDQAQVLVGRCYLVGEGVKNSDEEAIKWFRKAASKRNAAGMYNLARAHSNGWGGLSVDDVTAFHMYSDAAKRGSIPALRELGNLCRLGTREVEANSQKARKLLVEASDKGDVKAKLNLAYLYHYGVGSNGAGKDSLAAHFWYQAAAKAGDQTAKGYLAAASLGKAMAAFAAANASQREKEVAVQKVKEWSRIHNSLSAEGLLQALADAQVENIATVLEQKISSDSVKVDAIVDSMRVAYERIIKRTIRGFRGSSRTFRRDNYVGFSKATSSVVVAWVKADNYHEVATFWQDCYSDLDIVENLEGERDALIRQLGACIKAMLATGRRQEALKQLREVLALSDAILEQRPWDWYLKEATATMCWEVAAMLAEVGETEQVQPLLKRAWTIRLTQYSQEDLLQRYAVLPLKGSAPANASDADRAFFLSFASKAKGSSILSRFTIPTDFAGKKYPFHVYVVGGKRGYQELQDQFRWVREYRGGIVPSDVEDSFRKLNKIAAENDVDFRDLCVYALGTAQQKK